jgi:hypothetical protein
MDHVTATILDQIGKGALMMIGAREIMAVSRGVRFRIGRNAKAINMIRITLDPSDTYTVEFLRIRRASVTVASSAVDVYSDSLCDVIKSHTGMETSFPRIVRAS